MSKTNIFLLIVSAILVAVIFLWDPVKPINHEKERQYEKEIFERVLTHGNPYLTDEYLDERWENKVFKFFVIGEIKIENAVRIIYHRSKMPHWRLRIDLITSVEVANSINFDNVEVRDLLKRDDVYIFSVGGDNHPYLGDLYRTSENVIRNDSKNLTFMEAAEQIRKNDRFVVYEIKETRFLLVVVDEATYMMDIREVNPYPITEYVFGQPIILAFALDDE